MTTEEILVNLRATKEKHENDIVHTGDLIISDMCRDVINCIENLVEENKKLAKENGRLKIKVAELDDALTAAYAAEDDWK